MSRRARCSSALPPAAPDAHPQPYLINPAARLAQLEAQLARHGHAPLDPLHARVAQLEGELARRGMAVPPPLPRVAQLEAQLTRLGHAVPPLPDGRAEDLVVRGLGVDVLPWLERRVEGLALGAMGPVGSSAWARTVRRHRWPVQVRLMCFLWCHIIYSVCQWQ